MLYSKPAWTTQKILRLHWEQEKQSLKSVLSVVLCLLQLSQQENQFKMPEFYVSNIYFHRKTSHPFFMHLIFHLFVTHLYL